MDLKVVSKYFCCHLYLDQMVLLKIEILLELPHPNFLAHLNHAQLFRQHLMFFLK